MNPPKSSTTVRITTATDLGPASGFTNSPGMTVIELKGRTAEEKGHHYLQLSLTALKELAKLLEDQRLSTSEKAVYHEAYTSNIDRYDDMVHLRDRILAQKKSFRRFIINLFVREPDVRRFHKITYQNYTAIKRTSDDLSRRLLKKNDVLESLRGSAQDHDPICEESPREMVEGNLLVTDLPPNETIRGIHVDIHDEQEEQEVFEALNRIAKSQQANADEDDDRTIRPPPSQSRPSSPSSICTVIWNNNNYHINQSVVSFDSEVSGTTLNVGVDKGAGSSSDWHTDTNQPPSQ